MKGGKDAVLLIHGLTGSPFEMKHLAKRLHKAGFTVRVPLLAGHGTSIQELSKLHWQDWYGTVVETFNELKKEHDSVSVSGLCMGALLALQLAADYEDEVTAISLLSTTLFYDGWSLPWYKFLLPLTYYPPVKYFYSYKESPPYGIKNERLRELYLHGMKDGSIAYDTIPAESMRELYRLSKAVRKIMLLIKTPALILHSAEDDLASSKNADYIERHIGEDVVRKILLKDTYHMITIDNQKETVADETINFLRDSIEQREIKANGLQRDIHKIAF